MGIDKTSKVAHKPVVDAKKNAEATKAFNDIRDIAVFSDIKAFKPVTCPDTEGLAFTNKAGEAVSVQAKKGKISSVFVDKSDSYLRPIEQKEQKFDLYN